MDGQIAYELFHKYKGTKLVKPFYELKDKDKDAWHMLDNELYKRAINTIDMEEHFAAFEEKLQQFRKELISQ